MENLKKTRIFWEEILEIIPCGVSLRTISTKHRKESEKEDPDGRKPEENPGKTKELSLK